MKIQVLNECGYEEALLGLSLSFYDHVIPLEEFWTVEKMEKAKKRAKALAFRGGGHNKFLASIFCWMFVQAPRCWWSEYDTYKVATTANSSSTMHTLDKRLTTTDDFEEGTESEIIDTFNSCLNNYKTESFQFYKNITYLKMNLPEGWLQERQLCINYMTLQNIINQREGHRLKQWDIFITEVLKQIKHPYLLKENYDTSN